MKKILVLVSMILFILVLNGCGTVDSDNKGDTGSGKVAGDDKDKEATDQVKFKAQILQTKDGFLVKPDSNSNEYKASDKMSVNIVNTIIEDSKGQKISKDELKVDDIIEITYNGVILESYPAQISAIMIEVVEKK